MSEEELKPCPFCGSEAKHYYDDNGWMNTDWVSCENDDCGAQTCLHESKELALAAWNRRTPLTGS